MRFLLRAWLLGLLMALPAWGHIGSPNITFEGQAGAYPVRVTIITPGVIPGRAAIHVRVLQGKPEQVGVTPLRWDAGKKGSPPPDICQPVPGEAQLYSAELWLMNPGAYSVWLQIKGDRGEAELMVPVNAIATTRLTMSPKMGAGLLAFGAFLFLTMALVVAAAFRESTLPAGTLPDRRRLWISRAVSLGFAVAFGFAIFGGKRWWDAVDRDYRSNRLYKPKEMKTELRFEAGSAELHLKLDPSTFGRRAPVQLIPDHARLMHMFLIQTGATNTMIHLHPRRLGDLEFYTTLPPIPAGSYRVYGDITHESGFAETLVGKVEIPATVAETKGMPFDRDDSWLAGSLPTTNTASLREVRIAPDVRLQAFGLEELTVGKEAKLEFLPVNDQGLPLPTEPYMGMAAHGVFHKDDGQVFIHLHPHGTVSTASQWLFTRRELGEAQARKLEDNFCGPLAPGQKLLFPYIFPQAGRYQLWVQFMSAGQVYTAPFEITVKPAM